VLMHHLFFDKTPRPRPRPPTTCAQLSTYVKSQVATTKIFFVATLLDIGNPLDSRSTQPKNTT
jgi:hypothetical protein